MQQKTIEEDEEMLKAKEKKVYWEKKANTFES